MSSSYGSQDGQTYGKPNINFVLLHQFYPGMFENLHRRNNDEGQGNQAKRGKKQRTHDIYTDSGHAHFQIGVYLLFRQTK